MHVLKIKSCTIDVICNGKFYSLPHKITVEYQQKKIVSCIKEEVLIYSEENSTFKYKRDPILPPRFSRYY